MKSIASSVASGVLQDAFRPLATILHRRLSFPLFLLCAVLLARPCAATPGQWDFTNSLNAGRFGHTATLLQNGMVLVAGGSGSTGSLVSAELYDSTTRLWSFTGNLAGRRYEHTATLLQNGMVLVAGGYDNGVCGCVLASAELYDPATGVWKPTGSMKNARSGHKAVLLNNGRVLVIGAGDDTLSAELYNPATGVWTLTGRLNTGRRIKHTATLLSDGKVLVAGGGYGDYIASAEIYDPATGVWTPTGSLNIARSDHTATLLQNGMVLVAAGSNTALLASAELYDPATGIWSVTGDLIQGRIFHTATLLPNGLVLVAGGSYSTCELYDPATGAWSATGSLNQWRYIHTANLLPDGTVLAAGGQPSILGNSSAEVYGSETVFATTVHGRGAFDNQGNEVTFIFRANQGGGSNLGFLAICDSAAGVCARRGVVESLTIAGNTAALGGYVQLNGRRVTFTASVTDNGSGGTSDTISVSLSNGYSAGGTLTSGDIRIY